MKFGQQVVTVIACAALALSVISFISKSGPSTSCETSYARVVRTKTIRCGYIVNPPYVLKDANTGKMSGLSYEYMEAIGHELDFKVDWTEETGWGTFHEGLNSNRYDVMCLPVWESGQRAKIALLSTPAYYNSMFAYARADDDRFNQNLDAANKPDVRVAVMDGDITQAVKRMLLPAAQEVSASQMNASAETLMNVATKKADLLFEIPEQIDHFNANSTTKLKLVNGGKPVRLFANVFAVKQGEFELKAMLDSTVDALNTDGTAAEIVKKYGPAFSLVSVQK